MIRFAIRVVHLGAEDDDPLGEELHGELLIEHHGCSGLCRHEPSVRHRRRRRCLCPKRIRHQAKHLHAVCR